MVPLFFMIKSKAKDRNEKLANEAFIAYATIEKVELGAFKHGGIVKNAIYFSFAKNDTVYHKIKSLTPEGTRRLGIEVNNTYEMRVAKSDYNIFEIDFEKLKDTAINNQKFKIHRYD